MNPEVVALLEELAADPRKASVTFFPMGLHTHLTSDGEGGWNLETHTTVEDHETEVEETISHEEHLTTDELVFRMGMLAAIADSILDAQMQELMGDSFDAELEALLSDGQE